MSKSKLKSKSKPKSKPRVKGLQSALAAQQAIEQRAQLEKKRQEAEERKRDSVKGIKRPHAQPTSKDGGKDSRKVDSNKKLILAKRPTYPFEKDDTILLVGEGNFSYTLALLSEPHLHPPHLVCATAYDTEEECTAKYPDVKEIVEKIRKKGAKVEFGVDARKLASYDLTSTGISGSTATAGAPVAQGKSNKGKQREEKIWNRIVFNFPHAGAGIKDQDRNVLTNQRLLLDFLRSAAPLLSEGPSRFPAEVKQTGKAKKAKRKGSDDEEDDPTRGMDDVEPIFDLSDPALNPDLIDQLVTTRSDFIPAGPLRPAQREGSILITLKEGNPYTLWDLRNLAVRPPPVTHPRQTPQPRYRLLRSFAFDPSLYPGYEHRRTIGWREGLSEGENREILRDVGGSRTWEFALKPMLEEME